MDPLVFSLGEDGNLSQSTQGLIKAEGIASTVAEGDKPTVGVAEGKPTAVVDDEGDKEQEREAVISLDDSRGLVDDNGDTMETAEESKGAVEGEADGEGPSTVPCSTSKLQRFYFESDTLALKNNPE